MMNGALRWVTVGLLTLLGCAGCRTPDYGFPGTDWSAVRALRERGNLGPPVAEQISLGMTPPEVVAVWGKPNAFRKVVSGEGPAVVWTYYNVTARPVQHWCYVQRFNGGGYDFQTLLVPERRVAAQVLFRDGVVMAME